MWQAWLQCRQPAWCVDLLVALLRTEGGPFVRLWDDAESVRWGAEGALFHLRRVLATASDAAYDAALARRATHLALGDPEVDRCLAVLFPTEPATGLAPPDTAEGFLERSCFAGIDDANAQRVRDENLLLALGDRGIPGVGFASVLVHLPTDAAFEALLDRGDLVSLNRAATRYPQRALRLGLARVSTGRTCPTQLVRHWLDVLPRDAPLTETEEAVARGLRDASAQTSSALPTWLSRRPWRVSRMQRGRVDTAPAAVDDRDAGELAWLDDHLRQQERWGTVDPGLTSRLDDWEAAARALLDDDPGVAIRGAQPGWAVSAVSEGLSAAEIARRTLTLLGTDGVAVLVGLDRFLRGTMLPHLLPFVTPGVALRMAVALDAQAGRAWAVRWLRRHEDAAARHLVAMATAGRRPATRGVAWFVATGQVDRLEAAADFLGGDAAATVARLTREPWRLAPRSRFRPAPAYEVLPTPTPLGGTIPVGPREARELHRALAMCRPDEPFAGLPDLRARFTDADLRAFAFAARAYGSLPHLDPDAETVTRLAAIPRTRTSRYSRPPCSLAEGLDILDALEQIGTPEAMAVLADVAGGPGRSFRQEARQRLGRIDQDVPALRERLGHNRHLAPRAQIHTTRLVAPTADDAVVARWRAWGRRTGPLDEAGRQACRDAARALYLSLELPPPPVVFARSPPEAMTVAATAGWLSHCRDQNVGACPTGEVSSAQVAHVAALVTEALGVPWNTVRRPERRVSPSMARAAVPDLIRVPVYRGHARGAVERLLEVPPIARHALANADDPRRRAGVFVPRDVARELGGHGAAARVRLSGRVRSDRHLGLGWLDDAYQRAVLDQFTRDHDGVRWAAHLVALLGECSSAFLFQTVCVVSDFPTLLSFDGGRLHATDGPAVRWADGTELYAWDHVFVPPEIGSAPEGLTVARIDAEYNQERRRVMVERFGVARFLSQSQARVRDSTDDEAGQQMRLLERHGFVVLHVRNSTPEPDGRHREYFIRVPPEMQDCWAARNWTFALPPEARFDVVS
jgi:hypothetical protein